MKETEICKILQIWSRISVTRFRKSLNLIVFC